MFVRSDLGQPKKAPPATENRALGALVLFVAIVVLLLVALSADATIFAPLNASDAATQTSQAGQPFNQLLPPGHPPIPSNQNQNNSQSPV